MLDKKGKTAHHGLDKGNNFLQDSNAKKKIIILLSVFKELFKGDFITFQKKIAGYPYLLIYFHICEKDKFIFSIKQIE